MTDFETLLGGIADDGTAYHIAIAEDWLQGRTAYGGLAAAICVESAMRRFPGMPPLRSAQFSFVGPAIGTLTARPTMLRQGKSTSFVAVDLSGEAGLATRATFCFAAARASTLHRPAPAAPQVPSWEKSPEFYQSKLANFVDHFEHRMAGGRRPFEGSEEWAFLIWARHVGAAPASITSLIALADVLPPAAMVKFKQFVPLSTISWTIDLLTDPPRTEGWWLLSSQADAAVHGYTTQAMAIWDARGKAVAVGRQSIAIFV